MRRDPDVYFVIHQYFGIDVDIVWDIIHNKLPALAEQVRRILGG